MNMVEKVARAINSKAGDLSGCEDEFDTNKEGRLFILKLARVAIEAMREPNEEMIKAFEDCNCRVYEGEYPHMIDAALKE